MELGTIIAITELSASITLSCVRYAHEVYQHDTERARIKQEISALQNVVSQLHSVSSSVLQELQPALEHCQKDLATLEKQLAPSHHRLQKAKQKLLWPFKKEALEDALEMVERHKSTFSLALTLDVRDAIGKIRLALQVN